VTETTFPVDSFREAAQHLRRPFSPDAVHFKVQAQSPKENPKRGLIVGYVDARLVAERLNLVVPHLWQDSYELYGDRVDSGFIVCHLTIGDLTRSDIGKAQGTEGPKAAYSDAFKRAAVKFGIGVSLYAMSRVWLDVSSNGKAGLAKAGTGKKQSLTITDEADERLRKSYAKWVKRAPFGEALDHGDAPGSVGAAIEGDVPASEGDQQDNLEQAAVRQRIEDQYAEIVRDKPAAKRAMSKAKLKAKLDGCETFEDLKAVGIEVAALA
jgi:hypothetical protein